MRTKPARWFPTEDTAQSNCTSPGDTGTRHGGRIAWTLMCALAMAVMIPALAHAQDEQRATEPADETSAAPASEPAAPAAPASEPAPAPAVEEPSPSPSGESAPPATPSATEGLPPVGTLVKVELTTGDTLRGTLVSADATTVVLALAGAGQITLQRTTIASIAEDTRARVTDDGTIIRRDPNRTRYLYGPSAFGLEAGEGYFSQKELFFSAVAYGITDNITVLGGTALPLLIFAIIDGDGEAAGLNAILATKFSYTAIEETLHFAAGAETLVAKFADLVSIGFVFGSATYGNDERHLTLSVGKPFMLSKSEQDLGPLILTLSGAYRISRRVGVVMENWVMLPDDDAELFRLHGLAARLIFENVAVDIGGVLIDDTNFPVPWLDFTYNW